MSTETWDRAALTSRLGHPQEIASAARSHTLTIRFARRHPLITYLLTPIPALLVLWLMYVLGLIGIINVFDSYRDTAWAVQLAAILIHGIAYVPPVILTLAIAWLAIRSQTRIAWWVAAAGLVALVSAMMVVSLSMPTTPGTGRLAIGLEFPPGLYHWPQLVTPLALTALCLMWQARGRGTSAA